MIRLNVSLDALDLVLESRLGVFERRVLANEAPDFLGLEEESFYKHGRLEEKQAHRVACKVVFRRHLV